MLVLPIEEEEPHIFVNTNDGTKMTSMRSWEGASGGHERQRKGLSLKRKAVIIDGCLPCKQNAKRGTCLIAHHSLRTDLLIEVSFA